MSAPFVVATAQFGVQRYADWAAYEADLTQWVRSAVEQDAKLLVFPEYAAMALTPLLPAEQQHDLQTQIAGLQALRESYVELHQRLAQQHGVHILAGSFPWRLSFGAYCNRAWLLGPQGQRAHQDKQVMTRFEREQWIIQRGEPCRVFDTALGRIGVAICYDAEFPLLVRGQLEAGARLILVPSCTDGVAGYERVHIAARARALEGQCYVVQSVLVGEAPGSLAIDINVGAAGVFAPPDHGFPSDGVVARGELNQSAWVYATVDLQRVAEVRREGQVLNHAHWTESAPSGAAVIESLR
jgi:predicted amidohydrolase